MPYNYFIEECTDFRALLVKDLISDIIEDEDYINLKGADTEIDFFNICMYVFEVYNSSKIIQRNFYNAEDFLSCVFIELQEELNTQ